MASLYFLSAFYCSALPPRCIFLPHICLWPAAAVVVLASFVTVSRRASHASLKVHAGGAALVDRTLRRHLARSRVVRVAARAGSLWRSCSAPRASARFFGNLTCGAASVSARARRPCNPASASLLRTRSMPRTARRRRSSASARAFVGAQWASVPSRTDRRVRRWCAASGRASTEVLPPRSRRGRR